MLQAHNGIDARASGEAAHAVPAIGLGQRRHKAKARLRAAMPVLCEVAAWFILAVSVGAMCATYPAARHVTSYVIKALLPGH